MQNVFLYNRKGLDQNGQILLLLCFSPLFSYLFIFSSCMAYNKQNNFSRVFVLFCSVPEYYCSTDLK